jgi:uncharacterized membrane protein
MDKNIGIGMLTGLLIATTIFVYETKKFNKIQKGILYLCALFPPAQWILIIIFLVINYSVNENSKERKQEKEVEKESTNNKDRLQTLADLHNQGILTNNEYYEKSTKLKSEQLQTELKLTPEYKKLKTLLDDGILTKEEFEKKIKKIVLRKKSNRICEESKTRIKELVNQKISHSDYDKILSHYNKNNRVNKVLRDRIETILKINTDLSDEKFLQLIVKYLEEKFKE